MLSGRKHLSMFCLMSCRFLLFSRLEAKLRFFRKTSKFSSRKSLSRLPNGEAQKR